MKIINKLTVLLINYNNGIQFNKSDPLSHSKPTVAELSCSKYFILNMSGLRVINKTVFLMTFLIYLGKMIMISIF